MPPPPPPPPPSMPSMTNLGPSKQANKTQKSPDRNALLSDIRSGTRLKKAPKINDRSAPVIDGKPEGRSSTSKGNSFSNPAQQLGGLFAGGMPKLRSTGNPREPVHQDMSSTKGPAPSVPSNHRTHGHALPVLPNKPPNVNRSNSQVGNNKSTPKMTMQPSRQSPSVKPPPPPKVNPAMLNGVQPPLPSKPPNLNRRQSFGGNDVNYSKNSAVKSIANSPVFNTLKPPPPPRNNSVPNGLNNNVANTSNMLHSLPHPPAPPIPPPVSSIPSRGMKNVAHVAPMPQTPKMITRPHLGPPPPPPPHRSGVTNGTSYPAPPSQQRILAVAMTTRNDGPSHQPYGAPNPPIRNTSISRGDLDNRFSKSFKRLELLPAPESYHNINKMYPSSLHQSQRRRDPPPPPPSIHSTSAQSTYSSNTSMSSSMLHIQISDPRLYPSDPGVAQC